ncbi:VSP [Giardia duodenalis]|uniref:VSP n=1 Tax=Giardia intestinalis (strain ATCC 50803 / WB clone C6) TaxID=184922 RepID=A0A644F8J9_GIAIC|nr:VSP [Giardia intestinalis]XP_001709469.2 VSP [Giardia intestinalis]KAE8304974.1 VSP [Giardia intestinalis]KAE8304975.1 VSP [Giardia intestinalis]
MLYGLLAMFEKILFGILILQVARAAKTCTEASSDPQTGQCKQGKCISIGGDRVCTDCAKPGEVPINGECKDKSDGLITTAGCEKVDGALDEHSTTCGKCTKAGYFLHKGGCYVQAAPPGQTVCKSASSSAGLCETCNDANGFFKNMGASDNTHQSCIACNEADTIDGFRGVPNCKVCTPPEGPGSATCTTCEGEYYLLAVTPSSCVEKTQCKTDHFPVTAKGIKKCVPCGDTDAGGIIDCKTCTLKEARGLAGESAIKCTTCNGGKTPNDEGSTCVDAPEPPPSDCPVENCQKCSADKKTCEECKDKNYLTPTGMCIKYCEYILGYYSSTEGGKGICKKCEVKNCVVCDPNGKCGFCEDGFYADDAGICQKCDGSCKNCKGNTANDCTECKPGTILDYANGQKGKCAPECVVNTDKATGNCKACDLIVKGTRYCSACSQDNEYPQNGVCAPKPSGRAATCTSQGTGVCNSCANGLLRMNGGCYEDEKYPAHSVCATVATTGGTCDRPMPGFNLNNENNLVICPEGCKTCNTANECTECMDGYIAFSNVKACTKCHESCYTCETAAATCKVCARGYYKESSDSGPCKKCSEGLAGCRQCTVSSTSAFMCLEMGDSTGDNNGGSTNKSGLSTGAIAGISVAVIVVVGGLVGFLCWWFVCRGKA